MSKNALEQNKALVLEAFDTLFSKARLCRRQAFVVGSLYSAQRPHRPGRDGIEFASSWKNGGRATSFGGGPVE
jgi:hypothetical protein